MIKQPSFPKMLQTALVFLFAVMISQSCLVAAPKGKRAQGPPVVAWTGESHGGNKIGSPRVVLETFLPKHLPNSEERFAGQRRIECVVRLHWNGYQGRVVNPFFDPRDQSVAQLAVFDEQHAYLGSLSYWTRPPLGLLRQRHPQEVIADGSQIAYSGRRSRSSPRVYNKSGSQVRLAPGKYHLQAVVYGLAFPQLVPTHSSKEVTRSQVHTFEVNESGSILSTMQQQARSAKNKGDREKIQFRLRHEQKNRYAVEAENSSKNILEVMYFFQTPETLIGKWSPCRFLITGPDGSVLTKEFSDLAIAWKLSRENSLLLPPGGIIGNTFQFSGIGGLKGNYKMKVVFFQNFMASEIFRNIESPFGAVPNTDLLGATNSLEILNE